MENINRSQLVNRIGTLNSSCLDQTNITSVPRMAPYKQPVRLLDFSFVKIRDLLLEVIGDNVYYSHDSESGEVRETLEEAVREEVQGYLGNMLPSDLQTKLLSLVVEEMELKSPQLVVQLLFSERLKEVIIPLTCRGDGKSLHRVSELDISRTLETFGEIFSSSDPSEFKCLSEFLIVDKSEDPDFQGDPINNMTNTNTSRDTAGMMEVLETVSLHLTLLPALTHLVLPFASNNILAAVSLCPAIKLFQNIYRSDSYTLYQLKQSIGVGMSSD